MELVGVKVQVDWEKVGLGLGLEQSTLNTIRVDCSDSYSCMSRVFDKWYNSRSSEYTWKKLAEVLCSTTVNRQGLLPHLLKRIQSELYIFIYHFICAKIVFCFLPRFMKHPTSPRSTAKNL